MGRKKKSKVLLSKRNARNVMHRWKNAKVSELGLGLGIGQLSNITGSEGMPMSCHSDQSVVHEVSNDIQEVSDDEPDVNRTGFALYSSYNNEIEIDKTATSYILVDVKQLTGLVGLFHCPGCMTENSLLMETKHIRGYANTFQISCSVCNYNTKFDTSARLAQANNGKAPPFDINRRMVYTFNAMGKGPRALETFSMHMNMKSMQTKTYRSHKKALLVAATKIVTRNLELARCEVRKANSSFPDPEIGPSAPIDLTVSYDGSWHKRGFTSKYGVGCCIDMTTGLVIDFEVLSKYCRSCEIMKTKLKDKPIELENWMKKHKPNCEQNYHGCP